MNLGIFAIGGVGASYDCGDGGGVIGPGMTFLNSAVAVRGSAIYQHSFSACLGVIDGIAVVGCWVTRVTPVS